MKKILLMIMLISLSALSFGQENQSQAVSSYLFISNGNWNDGTHWSTGEVPSEGSDVIIMADAVIPAGYTAIANQVNIQGGSITVADGGQLKHNTQGLVVTMEKSIAAFNEVNSWSNYYLLAFPFSEDVAVPATMTAAEDNDFYTFDPDYPNAEWRNNKQHVITTVGGTTGYLYANPEDIELSLTGSTYQSYGESAITVEVPYTAGSSNILYVCALLGNPFTCNAYLYDDGNVPMNFMVYNEQGELVICNCGPIAPMQGFFVKVNQTTTARIMCAPFVFDEVVNPSYVPIDWENATLVSSNDSIGTYQIQFDGEMPELHSGSIVTIDQDTVVHHVFVETVSVNGNTMNLTSTEAYLTDIFAVTGFTLTTATNGKSSAKGKVFYPVAAYQCDEQGVYKPLDLQGMRDNRWNFTHNLWHYGENYDGEELFSGNNYSIYMEQLNYDFDLDLEIYMNFSGRYIHEIVGNTIDRYRSRALAVDAALLGTFNTEQKVRCDIEGSCSYSPGYDIWKHNLFRPLRVRFMVYGIPVIITLNSDLYRQVEVTASGEISAYAGFSDNAQGRVGFEWRQTGGISPLATFSNTFELTPPTVEGQGTVEAKAWAFPRVRLLLYNVVGPSFDFKPYLSTTVSGGFKEEMLGQSNDFCSWSLDCNTGIDAACGLSLQFMGYETQNYSTSNWNIVDRPLYHSPQSIQKASVGTGQTRTVIFDVYDHNHLFNTDVVTPLPQFVKFEADGELSSEYGIAQNGQVSVDWTPTDDDILYAKLYDINGNVMAWDSVSDSVELPSVTTYEVTNIITNYAVASGEVTDEGGGTVTERGICLDTEHNPSIEGNHVANGSGMGFFMVSMSNLMENTTYYVRAYATNEAGIAYGEEVSFTTLTTPTVTTAQVINISKTTATGGGTVVDDNGSSVTERGICWSTSLDPTTSGSHTASGSGTGSFTVNMTGLTANTTYYVRAYATNSVGTEYGNEVSFTTQGDEPNPDDWVDLGLPSGLLWATRNVGASSPEDYGDYFAWGETSPKSMYDWDTYAYGYYDEWYTSVYLTKYNTNPNIGPVDNLTTLLPEDDAATTNWGGNWRMPTQAEWQELINCTSMSWATQNGVRGARFTGTNGSTLFLPAAGYFRIDIPFYDGSFVFYWSSSLDDSYSHYAWCYGSRFYECVRCYGQPVRAVRSGQN